jgi:two-component system sensor histidine kinase MtrB
MVSEQPLSPTDRSERPGRHRLRRFRLTGLRLRLTAAFLAIALLALVMTSGLAWYLSQKAVLDPVQKSIERDVQASVTSYVQNLPNPLDASAVSTLRSKLIQNRQGWQAVSFFHSQAKSTSDSTPPSAVPAALRTMVQGGTFAFSRIRFAGVPYLVVGSLIEQGGPEVYVFAPLDDVEQNLNNIQLGLVLSSLAAIAGAVLVALVASRAVLRPVRALGDAARALGAGHLETRLTVRGSDELADLSHTFNETAGALQRSVSELRALEAASRRFVADVSHELRTPLTAMTAVSDLLEDEAGGLSEGAGAPAARLVVLETRRLARLVEDLIEVSRFDAGTAVLHLEDVDVAESLAACVDARGWSGLVELDAPAGLLAHLDPRRLDVIVANLVGNALKHGGTPVWVEAREEDGALIVLVADSGPGIPEDVLPHVFDRFYKADSSRARSEGSGLGLSIALENARVHGGTVTAANSRFGAVFMVRLPLLPVEGWAEQDADQDAGPEHDPADEAAPTAPEPAPTPAGTAADAASEPLPAAESSPGRVAPATPKPSGRA